jgi:RNA polymerase sigma factor (sigma-70 family)
MSKLAYMKEIQRRIALYDDEAAYKELFCLFYKPLLRFAHTLCHSHEMSEEIVSDVFISIWQRRATLEEIHNRQQKRVAITIDDLQVELESQYNNPEQLMMTAEMLARVDQAIMHLPPRCKLVYKLIKEDGLRYKEVAEILGISVKTIDNQLAIALGKIGKAINVNLKKVIRF